MSVVIGFYVLGGGGWTRLGCLWLRSYLEIWSENAVICQWHLWFLLLCVPPALILSSFVIVTKFKYAFLTFSVSSISCLFSASGKFCCMNGTGAIKVLRCNVTAHFSYLNYAFLYFPQVTGSFLSYRNISSRYLMVRTRLSLDSFSV